MAILNISAGVRAHRAVTRAVTGMGDINSDAVAQLAGAGVTASCRFVPFVGPLSGGANLCDVSGDNHVGMDYSAELIVRPGGLDILKNEIASAPALMAQRAAEIAKLTAYYTANPPAQPQPPAVTNITAPPASAGLPHDHIGVLNMSDVLSPQMGRQAERIVNDAGLIGGAGGPSGTTTTNGQGKTLTAGNAPPGGSIFGLDLSTVHMPTLPVIGGFDPNTIPLWGWGLAAVALVFVVPKLMGGGGGGRRGY